MRGGRFVIVLACASALLGVCKPLADVTDPAPPAAAAAQATSSEPVWTVAPGDAGLGVSVGFDGIFLYYTNLDELTLHRVDPFNLANHVDVPITGVPEPPGINAFSYDSTRGEFWAVGGDGGTIYLMSKTGVARLVMDVTAAIGTHGACDSAFGFCPSLVDGIGWDGTDPNSDTLWYSPDGSGRIYQFDTNDDPTTMVDSLLLVRGFFDINDPGRNAQGVPNDPNDPNAEDMAPQCTFDFSSGIGVGANLLYLTNGGCVGRSDPNKTPSNPRAWFFSYAKTTWAPQTTLPITPPVPPQPTCERTPDVLLAGECPGDKIDWFPYNADRAEDVECDDQSFHRRDNPSGFVGDVMWIRDAVDGAMRAYAVPTGSCIFGGGAAVSAIVGKFTGGGYLPSPGSSSVKAHTSFVLQCSENDKPNRLQVTWGGGNHFHMERAMSIMCSKQQPGSTSSFDTNTGNGTGRFNGQPGATCKWSFTDSGEPGTADIGHITVTDKAGKAVLQADGTLLGGNYQAHG